jgi:hypothetical protein
VGQVYVSGFSDLCVGQADPTVDGAAVELLELPMGILGSIFFSLALVAAMLFFNRYATASRAIPER